MLGNDGLGCLQWLTLSVLVDSWDPEFIFFTFIQVGHFAFCASDKFTDRFPFAILFGLLFNNIVVDGGATIVLEKIGKCSNHGMANRIRAREAWGNLEVNSVKIMGQQTLGGSQLSLQDSGVILLTSRGPSGFCGLSGNKPQEDCSTGQQKSKYSSNKCIEIMFIIISSRSYCLNVSSLQWLVTTTQLKETYFISHATLAVYSVPLKLASIMYTYTTRSRMFPSSPLPMTMTLTVAVSLPLGFFSVMEYLPWSVFLTASLQFRVTSWSVTSKLMRLSGLISFRPWGNRKHSEPELQYLKRSQSSLLN